MLRPLAELLPEVAASLDATRTRQLLLVMPAALRLAEYFVRCRPRQLVTLCDEDKIDFEDFITVSAYFGISTYDYEG